MTTTAPDLDTAAAVLVAVRADRHVAAAAETRILAAAVQWAAIHPAESIDADAAVVPGTEGEVAIAGPGAPLVAEFCVAELAAALGMSTDAGRRFLGQAVELRYRLPRLFARVLAGEVPAWKARTIAEKTTTLTPDAATWVDRHVTRFAHTIGPVQLDRLLDEALTRFMPEQAEVRRLQAAEHRKVDIHLETAGTTGTVWVDAVLDTADALDLETAIAATAKDLANLGSEVSLDVRRAKALGEIARRDLTLPYPAPSVAEEGAGSSVVEEVAQQPSRNHDRSVVLYLHLTDTALQGLNPVGRCGNTGTPVLTEQVRAWCATAARITVKPVLDLAGHTSVDAWETPDRHHEAVALRDHHCVFPHCRRRARRCDTDHITPWPHGPTCPCNLAPLCRRHHRHKTHGGWTYASPEPGTYQWRSPHGYHYRVDGSGTHDLDPYPADPTLDGEP